MYDTITPSPRDFYLMVLGQVVSVLGSAMLRFALSLYVLDITGRSDIFATLFAISSIPLLFSPLGGAIADRFNRRNLMVIFDFSSGTIVLCFFFSLSLGITSIIPIGITMFLLSVISAMYTPAVTASVPLLVAENKLEDSNGMVQAVQSLSGVAAPVLGGILYGIFDVRPLVIISCIAFFLSAVMEIFINIPYVKRDQDGHIIPTIIKDMRDGFLYAVKQPFILKSMVLAALITLILSPALVIGAPVILRVAMKSSDTMYGLGMGLVEFAIIIGALGVGYFTKKMRISTLHRWMYAISILVLPIAISITPFMLKLGYYPAFLTFMLGTIPIMIMATVITIFIISKVQKKTPNENLGKVMAIIISVAGCAAPIGQVIYGVIFESFSEALYLPIFAVSFLMLVITLVSRRLFRNESD